METMTSDSTTNERPQDSLGEGIPVGISACILGQEVRYNGGHKLDRFIRDTLGAYLRFVPVCPEVEIGLGVPRETLRLVASSSDPDAAVRLVAPKSGSDRTVLLKNFARTKLDQLADEALCGYILQQGSPSCGMERVRIYGAGGGAAIRKGRGLFAEALATRFPNLPLEEDGRLNDPGLRENFVERVFAYRRVRELFARRWKLRDLVDFHGREKLLVLAHDRPAYQELGRLVATAKALPRREVATRYEALFMGGLKKLATRGKQANVLQHLAGHFKKLVDAEDRAELAELIERYRSGYVPLVVPITLLRHHVRRHALVYLANQSYLEPHPSELMLRNHG